MLNFNFLSFVQITRRDETIQQLEGDLDTSRKQLKDAIEEVNIIFLTPSLYWRRELSSVYIWEMFWQTQ